MNDGVINLDAELFRQILDAIPEGLLPPEYMANDIANDLVRYVSTQYMQPKKHFHHWPTLDYQKKDILGQYPNTKWIGKSFFHPKTRRVYQVSAFIWNSSTDEWNVFYSRSGCRVSFTKTIPEFKEKFVQIEGDAPEED